MAIVKKFQTFVLINALILTICFPFVPKKALADDAEIAFVADVEYIVGVFNLANLLTGQFDFRNGWLENMTLRRVVRTDHGLMTMTIKSSQQWARVDYSKIAVRGYNLQPPTWSHLELLAPWRCPGYSIGRICAYDLWIKGENLETANMEIPDLVVETSFDPAEAQRVLAMQRQIEEVDLDEVREQLILAEDEAKEGKLAQQKEAYEQLKADLPSLGNEANKLEQLLEQAEEQSQSLEQDVTTVAEIIAKIDEIANTPEWHEQLLKAKQQQSKLITKLDGLTLTLDEVDELFKNIVDKFLGYKELLALRSEYLEELELDDWSKIYAELQEIKKKLAEIEKRIQSHPDRIDKLHQEKQQLTEWIEKLTKQLSQSDGVHSIEKSIERVDDDTVTDEASLSGTQFKTWQHELSELSEKLTHFNDDVIAPMKTLIDGEQWVELQKMFSQSTEEKNEKSEPIEQFKKQINLFKNYKKQWKAQQERLNALKTGDKKNVTVLEKQLNEIAHQIASIEIIIDEMYVELTLLKERSKQEDSVLLLIAKMIAVLEESNDQIEETTS